MRAPWRAPWRAPRRGAREDRVRFRGKNSRPRVFSISSLLRFRAAAAVGSGAGCPHSLLLKSRLVAMPASSDLADLGPERQGLGFGEAPPNDG